MKIYYMDRNGSNKTGEITVISYYMLFHLHHWSYTVIDSTFESRYESIYPEGDSMDPSVVLNPNLSPSGNFFNQRLPDPSDSMRREIV